MPGRRILKDGLRAPCVRMRLDDLVEGPLHVEHHGVERTAVGFVNTGDRSRCVVELTQSPSTVRGVSLDQSSSHRPCVPVQPREVLATPLLSSFRHRRAAADDDLHPWVVDGASMSSTGVDSRGGERRRSSHHATPCSRNILAIAYRGPEIDPAVHLWQFVDRSFSGVKSVAFSLLQLDAFGMFGGFGHQHFGHRVDVELAGSSAASTPAPNFVDVESPVECLAQTLWGRRGRAPYSRSPRRPAGCCRSSSMPSRVPGRAFLPAASPGGLLCGEN